MTEQLKAIILGNDGHTRVKMVDRTSAMVGNKYIVTQEDVFFEKKTGLPGMLGAIQPCIMFRENSIHAISRTGDASDPTPRDAQDTIESESIHLFNLLNTQSNLTMLIIMILAACAVLAGCGAAYMGYTAGTKIDALNTKIDSISNAVANLSYTGGGGTVIPVSPVVTTVPGGTVTVVPRQTPGLPLV